MTAAERKQIAEYQWALFCSMAKHIEEQTGRSFDDVTAELIAENIRAGRVDLEWAKRTVRTWPALASRLLTYLPDAAWLKEIAEHKPAPRKRKSHGKYIADAEWEIEAAQERHRLFKEKVDNGTVTYFDHLMELTTDAEANACQDHLSSPDPVQARIFEDQLDAMVWFQCLLMTPGAGMTEPREDGEATAKQRRREQECDESFEVC